jgi:heme oxygenase
MQIEGDHHDNQPINPDQIRASARIPAALANSLHLQMQDLPKGNARALQFLPWQDARAWHWRNYMPTLRKISITNNHAAEAAQRKR